MAALDAKSEVDSKERFFPYFQHQVRALQDQMDKLSQLPTTSGERNAAVDDCLAGIDRLSHEVKDASSYIPTYDQRTYGETIKALSEKLQTIRNSFNPPKRFAFKSRRNVPAVASGEVVETIPSKNITTTALKSDAKALSASNTLDKPLSKPEYAQQDTVPTTTKDNNSTLTVSDRSNEHIILQSATSTSPASNSGTLSNLNHCIIDLSALTSTGIPFATLYLKNIKSSLIICGHVAGAIHITDISNSVLVTACRQFRMHGSKNVDVYLHAASRPIFEDCTGLRFAPLPEFYVTPAVAQSVNKWNQIDDFKWLKGEPSPHFMILKEGERVAEEVWKGAVPGGEGIGVNGILKVVGVQ